MVKSWTDRLNAADEPKLDDSTPIIGRLTFGADFVRKRRNEEGLPV